MWKLKLAFQILIAIVVNNHVTKAQAPTKEELEQLFGTPPPPPNKSSKDCVCVPYYLCENGTIITDGKGLIDIRVKEDECSDALEVCCKNPLDINNKVMPTPQGRRGCGHRNEQGIGFRITGDEDNEAQFGEFPWMIGIIEKEDNNLVYKCGGSLIHQQVVLTTAHCVINKSPVKTELYARAGEWDTQTTHELYGHQQMRVNDIIIHEKYYSAALYNDIALLVLKEPFKFADNVDIICLPRGLHDVSNSRNCFASGWGKNKFGKEGIYQVILKKVELPIVPNNVCENKLRTTRLGKFFNLHESFVCAGGDPDKDTCKGDGGSPLVCPIEGKNGFYKQIGMVAWGIGCGTDTPGVYVNVPYFREWIDRKLAPFNFKLEYDYA